MKNKDVKSSLRQRAEELARNLKAQSPQNLDAYPIADIQKMFHELQVHQIELELQNEELHQTQVELENARLHYFDLYDKAPVGYITVSDEGLIQQSNDTAAVLLGAERAFLDEQSMAGFIWKEDQDIYHRQCRKILETGAPQESEVRVTKKDGSIFWAHLVMNATPEHARLYRVAICNITAQKLSEEALRLQVEERFCSLLNDMPDGFAHCRMVYDDQGHPTDFLYLNVNKAFERLTGLKNVVGKPVTEVIPNIKELSPELFELFGKVVSTGKHEKYEIFFRPMEKWLDISVTQSGEGCFAVIFEDISGRKQAENDLQVAFDKAEKQATQLEAIMDAVPAAVFVSLDSECWKMSGNRVAQQLLGLPALRNVSKSGPPEERPSNFREMTDGQEIPADQLPVQVAARGKEVRDFEFDLVFKDGKARTLLGDAVPLLRVDGQPFGAVGAFVDITDRKRAEEALRESEGKLILALDQTHLAYWEMDAATKTFTFNDRFYALYGTTAKREGGYRMPTEVYAREFMLPDERHIVSEDVARLLSGDLDQFQREHRIRRRDGQIRHIMVHVTVVRDASGRIVGIRGANQDITDLRRTEQALLLKNHVFDASIAANSIADTDSIMTEVNHTFLRIWGYPGKDAAVGKSITDFFNDFTEASDILQVLKVTGQWKGEFKAKRWNGSTFFAHGQATVLRDAAGEVIGYQSTVIDISDRKLAEEEGKKLEFLNRQLVKSESLARMAGAIAHHFNNQLATVIISLDMTKRALSQRDYSLEMLTEATQAAHRAAEMSTLMLTYLGQTSDKKEPLDIAETCLSYLPILRASMPHTVVLETDMPSHGPTAVASANQIKQALNNLMTNAWESIGTGKGSIRLVVKTVAAADIAAINRFPIDFQPRESTYACLEVADSGNGICDTDIEKIFDPFFSSKFAGRGLGLAVVLGIIKSHRGAITVASNLGRGSVFRVFLPMLPGINLTKPTRVLDQTVKAARRAGTVLVIEDEASLRKAVIFAIREIGFTVLEAADGVQGTEIFQQHKEEICLVICDLTMPRQGGWETISALRKIVPGIPIILASGYNESQVMAGSHSDLPQAFLSKPYEFEALRDAITRVLEKMDPSNVP